MDSSFRRDLQIVFNECCSQTKRNTCNDSNSNAKITKGSREWVIYIMRNYLPTIPIWSNLLLSE